MGAVVAMTEGAHLEIGGTLAFAEGGVPGGVVGAGVALVDRCVEDGG